jgi:hypothetical protein
MIPLTSCVLIGLLAAAGDRTLTVAPSRGLPAVESVTVYATKDGKRTAVAEATKFDAPLVLAGDGPFEVVVTPKGGLPVRAVEKLEVKAGAAHALKLTDVLGAVEVLGDDLPRPDRVVVTDVRDPGPGEKGHVAVQSAGGYRVGMAVPPGAYAVWVVPASGAKAQRVADNVRVKAGSTTRVGD